MARSTKGSANFFATAGPMTLPPLPNVAAIVTDPIRPRDGTTGGPAASDRPPPRPRLHGLDQSPDLPRPRISPPGIAVAAAFAYASPALINHGPPTESLPV